MIDGNTYAMNKHLDQMDRNEDAYDMEVDAFESEINDLAYELGEILYRFKKNSFMDIDYKELMITAIEDHESDFKRKDK